MKKQIPAILLSLSLLFGLLPGAVSAIGNEREPNAEDGLVLNKWVEEGKNGTFKLVLESYATGSNGTRPFGHCPGAG